MFWRKSAPAPDAKSVKRSPIAVAPANFPPRDAAGRAETLQFIREVPIAHGPWQSFKKLYKAIEAQPQADPALLAAMLARVDELPLRLPKIRANVWDEVPEGGPRARWDIATRRLKVQDAAGQEGSLAFTGNVQTVQLGLMALVASGDYRNTRLDFVDVSDATRPTIVASQKLENVNAWNAFAFAARHGHYLLVCFRVSNPYNNVRLMVFDVSQPVAPRLNTSLMLGEAYHFQAAFDGARLFFFGGNWNRTQLKIVDIADPTKPKIGGGINVGTASWRNNILAVQNGFAYVVVPGTNAGLKIVDGRDAAKPRETGHLKIKNIANVTVEGGRVYVVVDARQKNEGEEKGRFRLLDDSDPTQPRLLGAPPTNRTIGYLKRRARRLLWKLAQENPALYVDVAARLLESNGAALDFEDRWLSVDALLGAGKRFTQRRHGRAGYVLSAPRFVFKRREERFAALWDAHPDVARRLWQNENVSLAVREMAFKILRANRQEIVSPAPNRLEELLRSNSPLLQSYAVRALWRHVQDGGTLGGGTAALLLLSAPGTLRAEIEKWTQNARWSKDERQAFGTLLQSAVALARPESGPWRRRNFAAKLLAGAWSEYLDQSAMIENLAFWLQIGDAQLDARVLELLRKAGAARGEALQGNVRALARETAALPEAQRERLLSAFLAGSAGREFGKNEAAGLINQTTAAARLAWRILDGAALKKDDQEPFWKAILGGSVIAEAAAVAMSDSAALRVFTRAKSVLTADKMRNLAYDSDVLWSLGSADFLGLVLEIVPPADRPRMVFRALARGQGEQADILWQRYASLAHDFEAGNVDFQRAQFYGYNAELLPGAHAWDFLGASSTSPETLRQFWTTIFQQAVYRQDTQSFTHPAAPGLLRRAAFSAEQLVEYLKYYPVIVERASPEFFLAIMDSVPGEMRLQMLTEATPERWQAARETLLRSLEETAARAAFWQAIWEQLKGNAAELQERLLGDEAITATFERLEPTVFEAFLKTDSPAHEPWILRWLRAHKPERGAEILLLSATHNLPGVRKWALARAEYLRLDLASALRLIEAELADGVAAGRRFFEALPPGADEEQDYALALCDSPGYAARSFGREFIEERRATLFNGDLLARLAQHSSPDMQAWLAKQLLDAAALLSAVASFDRAVLRARGRARKAKNLVQARHDGASEAPNEAAPDSATLLQLARGRTRRDADWALRQLAQRALAGEKIEGVEIEL